MSFKSNKELEVYSDNIHKIVNELKDEYELNDIIKSFPCWSNNQNDKELFRGIVIGQIMTISKLYHRLQCLEQGWNYNGSEVVS